jgi:hypothetical protein
MRQEVRFDLTVGRRVLAAIIWLCLSLTLNAIVTLAQENPPKDGRYYE